MLGGAESSLGAAVVAEKKLRLTGEHLDVGSALERRTRARVVAREVEIAHDVLAVTALGAAVRDEDVSASSNGVRGERGGELGSGLESRRGGAVVLGGNLDFTAEHHELGAIELGMVGETLGFGEHESCEPEMTERSRDPRLFDEHPRRQVGGSVCEGLGLLDEVPGGAPARLCSQRAGDEETGARVLEVRVLALGTGVNLEGAAERLVVVQVVTECGDAKLGIFDVLRRLRRIDGVREQQILDEAEVGLGRIGPSEQAPGWAW